MVIKLGNFLTDLAIKFPTKKKDHNQRYKLTHVEIFPESDRDIMWKFINRYLAKNAQRSQWLERCGIQLMGSGVNRTMIVSSKVNICLDTFSKGDEEFSLIWDHASSSKKRKQCSSLQTPEQCAHKRSRRGGGICSVKPFVEHHSKSQTRIVLKLSKIAQQRIRAELGDKSTKNVQAVTLAVSGHLRRELTKYCTDESVLESASKMMTRLYGNHLTCELTMYIKGIRRLGLKIAERGSIVELYGLSNLTRSLRTCEQMVAKYQNAVTRLSIIIESNDIDALAISDANGETLHLTDQQHKKLRLQAMATILICTNLVNRYSDHCLKIEELICQMRIIEQDNTLQGEERSLRIELLIEVYNKYRYTMKVENSLPRIIGKVHNMLCQDKYLCRTITDWFNQYMASDNKGWRMDMRGSHERHCFLTEAQYDLETKLELFMQLEKSFSVEKCTEWLNSHIQHLAETYPHLRDIVVGKSQVHRWITRAGASCDSSATQKCYYTDRHEDEDNIKDRVERYIPELMKLSLREAIWVTVELDTAKEEAIADAKARTGLDDLPIIMKNGKRCIRIHADFLTDDEHVEHRRSMLETTGHQVNFPDQLLKYLIDVGIRVIWNLLWWFANIIIQLKNAGVTYLFTQPDRMKKYFTQMLFQDEVGSSNTSSGC
jgi:hypothetical protein